MAADNAGLESSPGWAVNRRSLAARGRRSSVAPSRLSGTGKMLSRLSVGLTDALHWLGIKGKIPTAEYAAGEYPSMRHSLAGAGAGMPERPALSPMLEGSPEGESPSPMSMAVTAQEQLAAAEDGGQGAAASSPAVRAEQAEAAVDEEEEEEEAVSAAPSPPPAATPSDAEQLSLATQEEEEDEQAAEAAAASKPAAAAMERLQEELAVKLQLHEKEPQQQQPPSPEAAEAAVQEAEEEAEELTPLQQLLVLCGQEVRPVAGLWGPAWKGVVWRIALHA